MNLSLGPLLAVIASEARQSSNAPLRHMLLDCRVATLLAMTGRSYKDTLA